MEIESITIPALSGLPSNLRRGKHSHRAQGFSWRTLKTGKDAKGEEDSYATGKASIKDPAPKHRPTERLGFIMKNIDDSPLPHFRMTPTGL